MGGYDDGWTEDQRALYDECHRAGRQWAVDPDTPADDLQHVINLAEAGDDEFDSAEIDYPPLVDAVTEVTGENVTSVPASHADPGFRGFVDGVRETLAEDVFGL